MSTPGPWHWEADEVKGDPTGSVRYQVTALGKTVTRVYYSSFEGGPTNAEADARLIAAAPDMLSALRAIAGMRMDNRTDHAQLVALCVATARVAVERATGE